MSKKTKLLGRIAVYSALLLALPLAYGTVYALTILGYEDLFAELVKPPTAQIFERDGTTYLWGGEGEDEHFDITEFHLEPRGLRYGSGREHFPALLDPDFVSVKVAGRAVNDSQRVLVASIGDEAKIYPIHFLRRHEVVNDTLGGRPIVAVYCILANLGAIYSRDYDEMTYTFAVSGYTYETKGVWHGLQAFVLWDRETESLWWPPIGKAVSGPSIDVPMAVLDKALWAQTTFGEARNKYPNAVVLSRVQHHEAPEAWHRADPPALQRAKGEAPQQSIAPTWGANSSI
jgi:hypothetical protein